MNIGLSYITQIRGGEYSGQLVPDEGLPQSRSLGGWVALTFNQLVASLTSSYHAEHNADDTHKTIHASGTISERSRTVPMGEWVAGNTGATNFSVGTGTWTVPTANINAHHHMLIGKTLFYRGAFVNTSVSAGTTPLSITIPGGFTAASWAETAIVALDNNVASLAFARVSQGNKTIDLFRTDGANWAIAAALTDVSLEISFEVQ